MGTAETVDQRWSFRCSECGAFKISDLRVYPDGRVEHLQMEQRAVPQTPGVETFIGVGGALRPAPGTFQVLGRTMTTLEAERRCVCGARVEGEVVTGKFSQKHLCDPACLYAVGDDCECSCGGANHGLGWVGLSWRLAFTPDGGRRAIRKETTRPATPELAAEARRLRAEARDRKAQERREAERQTMARIREGFEAEHGELVRWLSIHGEDDGFLTSIKSALDRFGYLTPGQIQAAERNMQRERDRQRQAEQVRNAGPAPVGRQAITGEIVSVKEAKPYWGGGVEYRMTIRMADANRVYFTVPHALHQQLPVGWFDQSLWRGRSVTMTATCKHSERDEHFSFANRITGCRLLDTADSQ